MSSEYKAEQPASMEAATMMASNNWRSYLDTNEEANKSVVTDVGIIAQSLNSAAHCSSS
jgi:hypothetical protein